jgi:hypothetical protein
MININQSLLMHFLRCRQINGTPSVLDIVLRINNTNTRTVLPPGWQWR